MARVRSDQKPQTAEQEFARLTIELLQPLTRLLGYDPPKRKGDLVAVLTRTMTDPVRVRSLYDQLEPLAQSAVREATHDPNGRYNRIQFIARHGREPDWYVPSPEKERSWSYRRQTAPNPISLFFPRHDFLPTDLRAILLQFVPPPDPYTIRTLTELPGEYTLPKAEWDQKKPDETVPIRVRETAREAETDLPALLRLIDAGKVRVTDKKRVPTEASRQAIANMLTSSDFFTPEDEGDYDEDPAHDLAVKAFAWPMLVQAAGLAEKRGDALKLTEAGRKALSQSPPRLLKTIWTAWQKTHLLDEFSRVESVKGQSRADLTAVATRRKAVLGVLKDCPPGAWFAVDDFWRFMRGTGRDFTLVGEYDAWKLYLADEEYGSLGYADEHAWEQLEGRFILAYLFEFAATVGLLDVAYVPPQRARDDFRGRWGADDLSCLSRYDGLLYLRINPLGAWILGQVEEYHPATPQPIDVLRVLANLDVVATQPPSVADRLTLERFADETSSAVWKLSAAKILGVVEQGGRIEELREFLATRTTGDIPTAVETFLNDLSRKAEQLQDGGPARIITCASAHVAAELANDRQLKGKCLLAAEQLLVVRETDLRAVRNAIRRLGYVWPIPDE